MTKENIQFANRATFSLCYVKGKKEHLLHCPRILREGKGLEELDANKAIHRTRAFE